MEHRRLKLVHLQFGANQTGVGTTTTAPSRLVELQVNQRSKEVLRLKSVRMIMANKVPGAGWAYNYQFTLLHRNEAAALVPDYANTALEFKLYESDSYGSFASMDRAGPQMPLVWNWDDKDAPLFIDTPYYSAILNVTLNAGAFGVLHETTFEYWIEKPEEREYQKLMLEYGANLRG